MHCHFTPSRKHQALSCPCCAAVDPEIGSEAHVLKTERRGALMIQVRLTNRVRLKTRLYGISRAYKNVLEEEERVTRPHKPI